MRDLVLSRAKRILNAIPNYRPLVEITDKPETSTGDTMPQSQEIPIGVYQDMRSRDNTWVIVTDVGLHIHRDHQWTSVAYREIANVQTPTDKVQATGLTLQLLSGTTVHLPITGREGKFLDSFEFLRFLNRVTKDIQQQTS
jgi:hypothetical protein